VDDYFNVLIDCMIYKNDYAHLAFKLVVQWLRFYVSVRCTTGV